MANFILNTLIVLALVLLAINLYYRFHPEALQKSLAKRLEAGRNAMRKEKVLGTRISFKRAGKGEVKAIRYIPKGEGRKPVVFVLHGGMTVDGTADQDDTFCNELMEDLGAVVYNIDYTTFDVQPAPYPQDEIADVIMHIASNSVLYGVDMAKSAMVAFGGGALMGLGALTLLKERGLDLAVTVACYPLLDESMNRMCDAFLHATPYVLFMSEDDTHDERFKNYKSHLEKAKVDCTVRQYQVPAGFMEYCYPEFGSIPQRYRLDEDEMDIAKASIMHLKGILRSYMK